MCLIFTEKIANILVTSQVCMELLEFVVDQFVWILLVLSPDQLPGSLYILNKLCTVQ